MKLGFCIPNNWGLDDVAALTDLASEAEALGYHSVWVSEHLFHSTYVAKRLGDRPYHDPLIVLTAIACRTSRVRLGTSVLVLPWHHPARLGKSIATLDQLSGGRVDLGIGVAITEDEFANLGVDFSSRGRRTDDVLAALDALWYQDVPEHDGEFFRFSGLRFAPKPQQQPLPVHVGGGSAAALRRVVRSGHGWHALGKSPDEMARDVNALRELMRAAGRDPDALQVSLRCGFELVDQPWERPVTERRTARGTEAELRAMMAAFAAAGVHQLVVDPGSGDLGANREAMRRAMELVS
ncbi:MAG TPA: LLM class F420-dependent oxidoreductase [Pseudomonadales bacterium]